jgi:hypothetical protein
LAIRQAPRGSGAHAFLLRLLSTGGRCAEFGLRVSAAPPTARAILSDGEEARYRHRYFQCDGQRRARHRDQFVDEPLFQVYKAVQPAEFERSDAAAAQRPTTRQRSGRRCLPTGSRPRLLTRRSRRQTTARPSGDVRIDRVPRLSLLSRALPGTSWSTEMNKRNTFGKEHG